MEIADVKQQIKTGQFVVYMHRCPNGKHHSEETKARLREISKVKCAGKNNGMYGKKHSEETKRKIGEKSKGRIPWNKGKKYTIKEISNHGDSRCQADD